MRRSQPELLGIFLLPVRQGKCKLAKPVRQKLRRLLITSDPSPFFHLSASFVILHFMMPPRGLCTVCPFSAQKKTGKAPPFFQDMQPQPLDTPQSDETALGGKNSSIGKSTPSKTLHGSSAQLLSPASVQSFEGTQ